MSNNTIEPIDAQAVNCVYVQHSEGKEMMTISFEYHANGKSKSFNLYRKANEPLSSSLDRIRLNVIKLVKVKKSKKDLTSEENGEERIDLEVIKDNIPIDPNKPNADAWTEGAVLKLNGNPYIVRRNEPQVTIMKLPTIIMKGFITLPMIHVANCDVHDCKLHWYRQISAQEREKLINDASRSPKIESRNNSYWLHLATGLTYSPTEDDIAHYLKVVCYPHRGEKQGPSYSCLSGRPVELGPTDCPFEKRHELTTQRFENCELIRFVSYNILADLYADQEYSRRVLFAHCPAHALEIDYRRQLLLKEIQGYTADIVCLQEVDKKEFMKSFEPYFKLITGHSGVFNTKGGEVSEGVATFFREDRFELLNTHRTILSRLIDPDASPTSASSDNHGDEIPAVASKEKCDDDLPGEFSKYDLNDHPILDDLASQEAKDLLALFGDIRAKMQKNSRLMTRFMNRHTMLQTNLLRFKDMPHTYVIVANTHLYFHPDADHIRLLQGGVCIKYLEYIKGYYRRMLESETGETNLKITIIFCGDMNSTPDCGLYKLVHEGKVSSDLKDWRSNEEEAVQGLTIKTSLRFSSAYKDIPYTNYTPGFNGCLDYIYYEPAGLVCDSTVPLPDHEDVTLTGGIPSDVFPSDHIALVSNLKFKQ